MDILTRDEMEALSQHRGQGPAISIYVPTHIFGEDIKQGPIMLKSLISEAEEQLIARGVRPHQRKKLLELPSRLVEDSLFWSYQSEGLAFFLSQDISRYYRLPVRFQKMAMVTDSFYIKPVLPLYTKDGQFSILAISQKNARLLMCTRDFVEEVDLGKEVAEFEKDIELQFPETNIQFHTGSPRQGGGRSAVFFSHGGEIDKVLHEKLLRYFRLIDRRLQDILSRDDIPLVLACVDHLVPLYREAGKYPQLMDEAIKGNPENSSAKELHKKAWAIVEPYFKSRQEEARARYAEQKGTGKVTADIKEIVPASYHGRVDTLFVALGKKEWGRFDPEKNEIELAEEPANGSRELLDFAAVQTFMKNGTVYAVDPAEMPDSEPVAAVLRY
ncbi:baeRF3 domain-containing protein [Dethiobacter alkaliphilus]|uniref:Uncharacterized protein n=1 Tax=Dethiobacter alkaliphilus AHT 1 TaxID=555088 RepID=C0GKC1_DETAL|nr:hypothetical protein [Dethiobacter alkaliphilus]EEG76236.1 conserved hypothetical protein [Dethiobacter alkaliphilus AHT 1]